MVCLEACRGWRHTHITTQRRAWLVVVHILCASPVWSPTSTFFNLMSVEISIITGWLDTPILRHLHSISSWNLVVHNLRQPSWNTSDSWSESYWRLRLMDVLVRLWRIYLRTCTLHRRRLVVLITTVAFKAEFSVPLQLLHPCPDGCDLKFFDGSAVLRPQTTKSILALFLY